MADTKPTSSKKPKPQAAKPRAIKEAARLERDRADREARFVLSFLKHGVAARAYREAGFKDSPSVYTEAAKLLRKPAVAAAITEGRQKRLEDLNLDVDAIFARYKQIAFSDLAEITAFERRACRYCHGAAHAYQWRTEREYQAELEDTIRRNDRNSDKHQEPLPSNAGGYGFSGNLPPNPECPECDGRGVTEVVFKDTREMTEAERAVFAGVEQTQHGIKYRFEDRMRALDQLAEHLQFFAKRDAANANAIANLLASMQAQGRIERMPLRKDQPQTELPSEE